MFTRPTNKGFDFFYLGIFVWLLLLGLIFQNNFRSPLFKGHRLKQFIAYETSENLYLMEFDYKRMFVKFNDLVLNTPIKKKWAEEPPIFHSLHAGLITLHLHHPSILPMIVYLLIGVLTFILIQYSMSINREQKLLFLLTVLSSPILLRYSFQHTPDLLAAFFLMLASIFALQSSLFFTYLFLLIAVTTKSLCVFPASMILFWTLFQKEGGLNFSQIVSQKPKVIYYVLGCAFLVVPFLLWIWYLNSLNFSHPFHFQSGFNTKHMGSFEMLWSMKYWTRILKWITVDGLGIPLFLIFGYWFVQTKKNRFQVTRVESLYGFWLLGMIPYYILVRWGNFYHDYYFLPFAIPMIFLATQQLLSLKYKPLLLFFLLAHVLSSFSDHFGLENLGGGPFYVEPGTNFRSIPWCTDPSVVAQGGTCEIDLPPTQ